MKRNINIFIFALLILFTFVPKAQAAWNPSYIIQDSKFTAQTMTEAQIQAFLVAQNSYLKNFTIPAGTLTLIGPNNTINSVGWKASHVIYMSATWYGLNPQVILTTLQKEQSLISTPTLNQYGIDWAMGYGVPDSGDRNYSYKGLAKQIDMGSYQLRWNMDKANSADVVQRNKVSPYYTGNTVNIDGVATYMGNGATASLYRYTPHFHGNQNFRTIFMGWFGNIDFGDWQPIYRFYNTKNGSHFFTASEAEKIKVTSLWASTYKYEGVAFQGYYGSGTRNVSPLYRLYNKSNGTHFYTASLAEKNRVIATWPGAFVYEGEGWHISLDPTNSTPVYRFYNRKSRSHFYTASLSEKNNVISKYSSTYRYEGVAYYLAKP